MIYHALNRANFRSRLFRKAAHYQDFLALVEESLPRVPMRIWAYGLMPNHYALKKSRPYGSEKWVSKAVAKFGLENMMRSRGRPRSG
jgi:hypothetical protein